LSTYDDVLSKTLSFCRVYANKVINYGNSWVSSNISKNNLNSFAQVNSSYLKIVSEKNFNVVVLDGILKSSSNDKNWG